ncbi:MAG: DDE-type integrase/transposase/recombinase [Campylobacterales bacterium]
MWVWAKEAAEQKLIDMSYEAIAKAVKRHEKGGKSPPYQYRYVDGLGRGGKKLEIYIEERGDGGSIGEYSGAARENIHGADNNSGNGQPQGAQRTKQSSKRLHQGIGERTHPATRDRVNIKTDGANTKYLAITSEEIPDIANPKRLTTDDKLAIIGYLKASKHQNNAIKALNTEYSELGLTKQRACRWKSDFRKHGVKALEDSRGRPKGSTKADEMLIKQALFASGAAHITSGFHCYCLFWSRRNAKEFDPYRPVSDISEGTFRRITERLKKTDKQLGAFLRVGKDGIKDQYPALPRHFKRVNQEWQIDATKLDFFVIKDGEKVRPTVVAIVDCYSGARVWGLYDSATSLADVRLLKKAIESLGAPELIRGDNGADYVSEHFQGVLKALGIAYHAAQAGYGRQKGKIERSFGSVQHSWLENLPGFIGHDVKARNSIEAQQIEKLERLGGAKTHTKCLPWETFAAVLDEYLSAKMESSGAAKKYREAREAGMIKEVEHLHRYLGKSAKPTVSVKGVQAFGRTYGGYEFWMRVKIGQVVTVREDIDDISRAYLFDMEGTYICEAIDNNLVSLSAEEAKAIIAHHKATYIAPARRMIKSAQEAGDAEYEELARMIAGEIKEKGKSKLDEKLKTENKSAANKAAIKEEPKDELPQKRKFDTVTEMFEAAIKEGWTEDEKVVKARAKYPELWEISVRRTA